MIYNCQICGEEVERKLNNKNSKFTCFNCKSRRNNYAKKKASILRPLSS